MISRMTLAFLSGLILLSGCDHNTPPPASSIPGLETNTPDPKTDWAQVLRAMDDGGLTRNDQRTLTSLENIRELNSFFPELATKTISNVHGNWHPWLVVHLHSAAGIDTYISTDYRLYRIDDGARGDFVIREGFTDYVQRMFMPGGTPQ
jgi:hypothetical protein